MTVRLEGNFCEHKLTLYFLIIISVLNFIYLFVLFFLSLPVLISTFNFPIYFAFYVQIL